MDIDNDKDIDVGIGATKTKTEVQLSGTGKASSQHKTSNSSNTILKKPMSEYFSDRLKDKVEPYEHLYENLYYAPASEFAVLRQEYACLEKQLVEARVLWREDQKVLKERWETAVEKHNMVHDAIPKFNSYYKELFAKRDRAVEQQRKERKQCEMKERELRKLHKEKKRLEELYEEQELRLDKFYMFKFYLDCVVESSKGEYSDVKNFIDRFGILAEARNNLKSTTDFTYDNVQRNQKALERDILSKETEVLALKNYLSELMDYQKALNEQVLLLEENLIKIKMTAAERTLIIGTIKMAIRNLYMQICKHMHRNARISPEDTLGQLLDIRISVKEVYKLARDIKQMLRQAYLAAETEAKTQEKQRQRALERQNKIDKLTKKNKSDPRELFGLKKADSVLAVPRKSNARFQSVIGGFVNPLAARIMDEENDHELGLFTFGSTEKKEVKKKRTKS